MEFKKQNKGTKKKRDKPKNRLLTIEKKLMVTKGKADRRIDEISDRY